MGSELGGKIFVVDIPIAVDIRTKKTGEDATQARVIVITSNRRMAKATVTNYYANYLHMSAVHNKISTPYLSRSGLFTLW